MIKNQEKLGITGSQGSKHFYNEFIHNILSNGQDIPNEDRVAQCLAKIDAVAIVTIIKPDNEVIVITKSKRMLTSVATLTGGLLSLYAGFSFLSFGEVMSLTLRVWKRFIDNNF